MIFPKKLIFAFSCCAVFAACVDNKPPENRYDKIASGFCECTAQLATLNKEAAAMAEDTTGKGVLIFKQMETEYNKAKDCSAAIVAQFGRLKKEEIPLVQKALTGKCPDLATQRDLLVEMLGE